MTEPAHRGESRAVQGCLFGAVALFAFLLIVLLLLAYQRFREETGRTDTPTPIGLLHHGSDPVVCATTTKIFSHSA